MAFVECNLPHPWEGGLTTRMGARLGESAPSSEAERDTLLWSGRNTEIPPWFLGTNGDWVVVSKNFDFHPYRGKMSNSTNMGWKKWRFLKVSTNSSNYSSSHKNMMLMKRNCTSGYMYVAAFGGSAVLKLSVGMLVFVRILGDFVWGLGAYFSGASRSFQGVYHCQNICQCQWIFLMKPRMFRLGTFWPYCRWIHLYIYHPFLWWTHLYIDCKWLKWTWGLHHVCFIMFHEILKHLNWEFWRESCFRKCQSSRMGIAFIGPTSPVMYLGDE